jgi:hypothetical protein
VLFCHYATSTWKTPFADGSHQTPHLTGCTTAKQNVWLLSLRIASRIRTNSSHVCNGDGRPRYGHFTEILPLKTEPTSNLLVQFLRQMQIQAVHRFPCRPCKVATQFRNAGHSAVHSRKHASKSSCDTVVSTCVESPLGFPHWNSASYNQSCVTSSLCSTNLIICI